MREHSRAQHAQTGAGHASGQAQGGGFHQELTTDQRRSGAERFSQADLTDPSL